MELSKTYEPRAIEEKWYEHWEKQRFNYSKPDKREPFTVVIPPPNVTGILHMGHILNNTIQDILVRKARLDGFNACWVPGTDHASIATEAKVVAMLKEKGIDKDSLTREEFMKYAWEWKEKYGGIILKQLQKLGASCDWDRTTFTMDEDYYAAVIKVFIDLHEKGYIYRGVRIINWDPDAKTALSNEEVIYKEVQSKLFYVKYQVEGESNKWVTIATTRPETILGDTAVCVHPDDDRYSYLTGKKVLVPLVKRPVPVIFDEYVDREFGTGALKVTPAHDPNDYELGDKHQLESIDILNDDGTMSEAAQLYVGKDRFKARKLIIQDIENAGQLEKVEELTNKVGYSERTNAVVEPKLSMQWFMKMDELSKPALDNVINNNISYHPAKFQNMYRHWMENIKDWCISRQLWWGQRIPVWYLPSGKYVVAEKRDEAFKMASRLYPEEVKATSAADLRQDEDVLDTWFSSWLWPIALFKGFKDPANEELAYYYPSTVLVTAPDIIFFWVARMIISGYEYMNDKPFHHVYFTGTVRDPSGRRMSKSLGNSPDPLVLIDKFGADAVRFGIMVASPAGNDLLFDDKLCDQGRNFCNKIWNALRLVKGWDVEDGINSENVYAVNWFSDKLNSKIKDILSEFKQYNLSAALKTLYSLIWEDFCSWYLEMIKPKQGEKIDRETFDATVDFFEKLMTGLHSFMPFITEEIYHQLKDRKEDDCIMVSSWPKVTDSVLNDGDEKLFKGIVTNIRNIRSAASISPKDKIDLLIMGSERLDKDFASVCIKMANLEQIIYIDQKPESAKSFIVEKVECYVPVEVDKESEKDRLNKEIEYTEGFLISVQKKLENERFVKNASEEIVGKERKKLADAELKIKILKEQLVNLN